MMYQSVSKIIKLMCGTLNAINHHQTILIFMGCLLTIVMHRQF